MNKLLTKIATAFVGIAMAIGVGVAAKNGLIKEAKGAEATVTFDFEDSTAHRTSGNNSYTGTNSYSENGATISLSYADSVTTGSPLSGSANIMGRIVKNTTNSPSVTIGAISFASGDTITGVSYKTKGVAAMTMTVSYSTDGSSYTTGQTLSSMPTSSTTKTISGLSISTTSLYLKWAVSVASSTTGNRDFQLDDVVVTYTTAAAVTYSVTYNGNGNTSGSVPTDNKKYNANDTVTVLDNTGSLEKTGHTFSGWNTESNGSGDDYVANSTFSIGSNTTLYAQWTPNKYSLSYNANGGTGSVAETATYDYGTKVDVADGSTLTKSGFVFAGWNTASDGTGSSYAVGSKITIEADTILYAKWKAPLGIFQRVENVSELTAGDVIAILRSGKGNVVAMSTTQNSNNRGSTAVTVSNDYTFQMNDEVQEITLGRSNDHWTFGVDGGYLYAASSGSNYLKTQEENDANGEWVITITDGIASIVAQGSNARNTLKNNGDLFSCYGSGQTDVSIYKPQSNRTLASIKSVTADISLSNSDTEWQVENVVVTGRYSDSTEDENVTTACSWEVLTSMPTVTSTTTAQVSFKVTGKQDSTITKTVNLSASLTYVNPLEAIYSMNNNDDVDVYGYYVGFLDGTGPVIMDGDYGVVIFDKTADVSSYTANETILHVTGSVSIYKGLYEIGSATIALATGTYDAPSAPVVYSVSGGETASYASRSTTLTGVVKSVTPATSTAADYEWDQTEDVTIVMTVNSVDISVFYKKAAQNDTDGATIVAALTSQDEITIKGFTGWYNAFQVQMNGIVAAATGYTALEFAQDLLDQTDAVCENYDGVTNNHDAILAIWNDLASVDKYPSLPTDQKNILASATYTIDQYGVVEATNSTDQTIAEAMARYEYLAGKYNLANFINGRTPVVFANSSINMIAKNGSTTTIIVVVSMLSLISVSGFFFFLRRRKEQ